MKTGNESSKQPSELRSDEQQLKEGQIEQTSTGGQQEQSRRDLQQEELGQQSGLEEQRKAPREGKELQQDLDEE
jgi:hypothetical protein